jgi:hypothetical protein
MKGWNGTPSSSRFVSFSFLPLPGKNGSLNHLLSLSVWHEGPFIHDASLPLQSHKESTWLLDETFCLAQDPESLDTARDREVVERVLEGPVERRMMS